MQLLGLVVGIVDIVDIVDIVVVLAVEDVGTDRAVVGKQRGWKTVW